MSKKKNVIEMPAPWSQEKRNSFKILLRSYYDYQDERLALDGRLGIKKDGEEKKGTPPRDPVLLTILMERHEALAHPKDGIEAKMLKEIEHQVKDHPLWPWAKKVKGLGPAIFAVLVTEFDINIATTVSKMWQFAGLNPGEVRGKKNKGDKITISDELVRGDRKTKGFLCPFNGWLRSKLCGVLASSFIKAQAPHALDYYYPFKHRLESMDWGNESKRPTDKDRPKAGHQDKAAKRYMIKMFLRDLYVAWRTLEGLPVRPPYQEEYLGKKHSA